MTLGPLGVALVVLSGLLLAIWAWRIAAPVRFQRLPKRLGGVVDDPEAWELIETISHHCLVEVFDGNRVELLVNGDQIFPSMLRAIDEARDRIEFLTFVYWTGEIADRFAERLAAAARRGVTVRVLIDGFGGLQMRDELIDGMRDAGCQVSIFTPLRPWTMHRANFRTHRKVLVADGDVGFTGGVGIAEEWEGDARDPSEWRDNHFRMRGSAVRYLETAFEENWRYATGELVIRKRPASAWHGEAVVAPVLGRPGIGVSKVALAHWFALERARRRLWIQTPYFVPPDDLIDAMARAVERGVDVRLMVPGDENDSFAVSYASRNTYPELVRNGVRILRYEKSMIHCKSLVIDEDLSVVGSANLDHRSFELNYEMLLAVADAELNGELARQFERDAQNCVEVTAEALAETPLAKRGLQKLFFLLRHQL